MRIIFLFIILFLPVFVSAQTECVLGLVDDPAPGSCGVESVDSNGLISGSEIKAMKIYEVAEIYGISEEKLANEIADELGIKVKQGEFIQVLHDNYGLEASKVKEIAGSIVLEDQAETLEAPIASPVVFTPRYRLVPIVTSVLFLYLITYILVLQKKIAIISMRRIWNVLLLISFLISAVLGLLLIIRINYGWYISLPFNMLYWHVEFATIMIVITLIHLSWYWRFYTSMFRGRK